MDRVDYQSVLIQDLLNQQDSGELNLSPWYQRRSVWNRQQKSYLINTLFCKMPVPSIYMRHSLDLKRDRSIKEIVDGQQRIRSLIEYADDNFPSRHPAHEEHVTYSQLTPKEQESFRLTSLSVGVLVAASDADVIEMFGRLNSVAKTLNLQEKRNARYSGEFKQFCLRQATKRLSLWRDADIFTANDIARMNEVQFVSELVIALTEGDVDYSAKQIDEYYKKYDSSFGVRSSMAKRLEHLFSRVLNIGTDVIKASALSRPPLFYSLLLCLDKNKHKSADDRVPQLASEIDALLNADIDDLSSKERQLVVACKSNLHRIKSRQVRFQFMQDRLAN